MCHISKNTEDLTFQLKLTSKDPAKNRNLSISFLLKKYDKNKFHIFTATIYRLQYIVGRFQWNVSIRHHHQHNYTYNNVRLSMIMTLYKYEENC